MDTGITWDTLLPQHESTTLSSEDTRMLQTLQIILYWKALKNSQLGDLSHPYQAIFARQQIILHYKGPYKIPASRSTLQDNAVDQLIDL